MSADTSITPTQRLAAHDAAVLAKPLDHATALNGIGTLDAAGERAAADALRHLDQQHAAYARAAERALDALERLHARILRDLPGDASEVPQPDDEYWARTLADLVAFADSVYLPVADGAA